MSMSGNYYNIAGLHSKKTLNANKVALSSNQQGNQGKHFCFEDCNDQKSKPHILFEIFHIIRLYLYL